MRAGDLADGRAPSASGWRPASFGVREPSAGLTGARSGPRRWGRRRQARRGPRHARPSAGRGAAGAVAALSGGGLLLAAGAIVLAAPLWSGWWTAAAQRQAAAGFARGLAAAEGAVAAVPPASQAAGASAPAPIWAILSAPPASAASSSAASSASASTVAAPPAPAPVPGPGDVLARLVIPAIGVDSYVLEGLTFQPSVWEGLLRRGPAHLLGSALPGQPGNAVIFGHLNVWGSVFLHLDRLGPGDPVLVETPAHTYVYRVTGARVVEPLDAAALAPHGGAATLQLVTCTGLFDTRRLLVTAVLDAGTAAPPAAVPTDPVATAEALVQRYEGDLARGDWVDAYGLLSAARQAWTTPASLRDSLRPPPAGAGIIDAWPLQDGDVEVLVREGLGRGAPAGAPGAAAAGDGSSAGDLGGAGTTPAASLTEGGAGAVPVAPAGAASPTASPAEAAGPTPGAGAAGADPSSTPPAAPAAAADIRIVSYTVAPGAIVGSAVVTAEPLLRFDIAGPSAPAGRTSGQIQCGAYRVDWTVGPVEPAASAGFTFQARPSALAVTGPGGQLAGIEIPDLTQGTYPIACGDLVGDGSTALALRTDLAAGGESTVAIYVLAPWGAVLIGQMPTLGGPRYPELVAPAAGGPYRIVTASDAGLQWWAFSGGRFAQVPTPTAPAG